jgi:hypothetical protein
MSRKPVPFQQAWIVKFGLEISTRGIVSSKVTTSLFSFFAKTAIKYFTSPCRSDYFVTHLKNQHMSKWETYKGKIFSRDEKPEAVAMRSFVQTEAIMKAKIFAHQKCLYMIDVEIIEQLIGDLLFDSNTEDVEQTTRNAMKVFFLNGDDEVYVATVKSVLKLNMIVKFIAVGISFRQESRLYQSKR